MAGNPGAGKRPKKPAGAKPVPGRKGCYRDPSTGKFVCPPGAKPKGKPATPAGRKPPKGWFPMPDQRDLIRSDLASKPKPRTPRA